MQSFVPHIRPVYSRLSRLVCVLLGAALLAAAAQTLVAAPQPEPVPRRWEFRVDPGPLRMASVSLSDGSVGAYFYFTFKVTNNSGQDQMFSPAFEMYTDDGEIVRSGRGVPRVVTEEIMHRLRNDLLMDEIAVQGRLLQGPENAREGVVIWPAQNLKVDEVVLFGEGFSGETHSVVLPDTGERKVLRKTLMLRHDTPGAIDPSSSRPLRRSATRWIMR